MRSRRPLLLALWTLGLFAGVSAPAAAHKSSDAYLSLERDDAGGVRGQWDIALRDLELAIGLDANANGEITWGELRAQRAALDAHALSHLRVTAGGAPCDVRVASHQVDRHTDGAYAVLGLAVACVRGGSLAVEYDLLFAFDPQHRGLLRIADGGAVTAAVLSPAEPRFAQSEERGAWRAFRDFAREGVWHIWIGFDHVLFLLCLLLPAVVRRVNARWEPVAHAPDAARETVRVVSAFTLSHSLTLALAAFGAVAIPSRLVESAIAASIVVTALDNVRPFLRAPRAAVAFGFGLVHGLGFASVLAELGLPRGSRALALFGFNFGVELGQLAIVAAFLPLALAVRTLSRLSAHRACGRLPRDQRARERVAMGARDGSLMPRLLRVIGVRIGARRVGHAERGALLERGAADVAGRQLATCAVNGPTRVEVHHRFARLRESLEQSSLDRLADLVQPFGIVVTRYHEVQIGVDERAGAPRAQAVDVDPFRSAVAREGRRERTEQRRIGLVHQAAHRAAREPHAFTHDVRGHEQRDGGVEPDDAGELDQREADQDARARVDVGQHVLAIRDQRQRVCRAADAQQVVAERRVAERQHAERGDAEAEIVRHRTANQLPDRLDRDQDRRDDDQRALDARGQELDLAVPVRVIPIRRPRRDQHAEDQQRRGGDVDGGFERIRQHRDRAGELPRDDLSHEDGGPDDQRDPSGATACGVVDRHGEAP